MIYEALLDDEHFRALPSMLARHFGARSCLLAWHSQNGGADLLADSHHYDPAHLERYATEFAPHDPWLKATEDPSYHNRALNLEQIVPVPEYLNSFFYNEFIREIGDDNVKAIGIRTGNRFGVGLIALHRGKPQSSFEEDDVAMLDNEALQLRRMLTVRARFEAQSRHTATLEAVLDHMRDAALLVGPDRRLSYANRVGEAMLAKGDLLLLERARIAAASRDGQARLQAAIEAACCPSAPAAGAVLLERRDGRTAVLTITPFKLPHGRTEALILTHAGAPAQAIAPQLRRLFGLTRSEAEIAARIGDGLSLAEIAEERRVASDTIRSQVKALMAKLGCRRQSEVVALVKAIPMAPDDAVRI